MTILYQTRCGIARRILQDHQDLADYILDNYGVSAKDLTADDNEAIAVVLAAAEKYGWST